MWCAVAVHISGGGGGSESCRRPAAKATRWMFGWLILPLHQEADDELFTEWFHYTCMIAYYNYRALTQANPTTVFDATSSSKPSNNKSSTSGLFSRKGETAEVATVLLNVWMFLGLQVLNSRQGLINRVHTNFPDSVTIIVYLSVYIIGLQK